jgi:hypothetical protein
MRFKTFTGLLLLTATTQLFAAAEQSLNDYRSLGAGPFDAQAGRRLWLSSIRPDTGGNERSCSDCHGQYLELPGKHIRTGKVIDPMNPAVTPQRLANSEKIEKWFLRNCKWTFGRECTAQEKGDLILFIQQPGK